MTARRLEGKAKIGGRIGRVVNQYKVAKHFELTIEDRGFDFKLLEDHRAARGDL